MTEDEVKLVLLVRTIEEEDHTGDLLTKQDRAAAHEAGRAALSGSGRKSDDLFLIRRAEFATGRLASRNPAIGKMLKATRWPKWLSWALPLAAFMLGAALNELGNGRRLDLLALPLLGMIAWNAAVYFGMLVTIVPRARRVGSSGLAKLVEKAAYIGQRSYDMTTPIARGLGEFAKNWGTASASLSAARSARILHLSAALFAIGVVAGIYGRALGVEYRAGWESTFLSPDAVHTILTLVLGPASLLTGVPIPDVDGIAAIRWTGAETGLQSGGANAGPWIFLTTTAVAIFVIIPRLIFAGLAGLRTWRRRARFKLPGRDDFYFRRLLRGAHGKAGSVRVTPYAYHPNGQTREALAELIQDALGDGAVLKFDAAVEYGEEDSWLAGLQTDGTDDHHLLLFTLSATPEHENHGALATGLRKAIAKQHPGSLVSAVIDESAFRARFGTSSAAADRLQSRGEAWDAVLGRAEIPSLQVDLAGPESENASRIEDLLTGALPRKVPA